MKEIELQRQILDAVNAAGVCLWRNQSGRVKVRSAWMYLAPKGSPDLIGYLPNGRMLAFEVKTGKYQRTMEQLAWGTRANSNNVAYFCVTTLEQAMACLKSVIA